MVHTKWTVAMAMAVAVVCSGVPVQGDSRPTVLVGVVFDGEGNRLAALQERYIAHTQ